MISIHIEAHPDRGDMRDQIDRAMQALGFQRETEVAELSTSTDASRPHAASLAFGLPYGGDANTAVEQVDAGAAPAARERGKAAPGHARRTKAEIAEDDAADKADADRRAAGEETGAIVADKQVDTNISSGAEDRVDPDNPEDAAQDAVDEAAETAASKGGKLTLDDVRNALGKYVQKFGMDAAQADGPKVISMVCGSTVSKVSAIPDDQAILQKVIGGIDEMLTKNPFQRAAVA